MSANQPVSLTAIANQPDWVRKLVCKKRGGEPYADERNVRIAFNFAPELAGILQYNEFSDRIELKRPLPGMPRDVTHDEFDDYPPMPWQDEYITEVIMWLTTAGMVYLRRGVVQETVIAVAKRNAYHPVRDYLLDCYRDWDKQPRLLTWLKIYLGAKDAAAYLEAVGRKFMIGAVARIFQPGCQMDTILVLEGEQGLGKSTAVSILGGEWSRDIVGDLANKDAAVAIQDVWIGEMGELTALKRGDQEAAKGFISRRIDHYRPPYGRNAVDRPRHTVFIATTNEYDYLQDPTGARRTWPIECAMIDLAALKRDVRQLWGEAMAAYYDKEPWHLTDAETRCARVEQVKRSRTTETDAVVLEWADKMVGVGRKTITMREVLAEVFEISPRSEPAKAGGIAREASRALMREGWRRDKPKGYGQNRTQSYTFVGLNDEPKPTPVNGSKASHSDKTEHPPQNVQPNLETGQKGQSAPSAYELDPLTQAPSTKSDSGGYPQDETQYGDDIPF